MPRYIFIRFKNQNMVPADPTVVVMCKVTWFGDHDSDVKTIQNLSVSVHDAKTNHDLRVPVQVSPQAQCAEAM